MILSVRLYRSEEKMLDEIYKDTLEKEQSKFTTHITKSDIIRGLIAGYYQEVIMSNKMDN